MADAWTWIVTNQADILLGIEALLALASVVTGLTRAPRASGVVALLQTLLGRLSVVVHHDAPGTFKLPGTEARGPR